MARKDKTIEIELNADGRYTSKTKPARVDVTFADLVLWLIVPKKPSDKLPSNARVELRFKDPAIVGSSTPSDRKAVGAAVHSVAKGSYKYDVWFVSPDEAYKMEDPELVMDGEQSVLKELRKKWRSRLRAVKKR